MGSKYLKAIVPRVIGHSMYELGWRQGGTLLLAASAMWALRHDARTRQDIFIYNWEQLFRKLPLIDLDREAGKDVPFFRDWIAHPDYDDYWRAQSIEERYQDIGIPVLQIGGWYDRPGERDLPQLHRHERARRLGTGPGQPSGYRGTLGP